jgi:hypothetical protein
MPTESDPWCRPFFKRDRSPGTEGIPGKGVILSFCTGLGGCSENNPANGWCKLWPGKGLFRCNSLHFIAPRVIRCKGGV